MPSSVRILLVTFAFVLSLAGCQGERLRETTQPGLGELFASPSPAFLCSACGRRYLDAEAAETSWSRRLDDLSAAGRRIG